MPTNSSTRVSLLTKFQDYWSSFKNLRRQDPAYIDKYIDDCLRLKEIYERHSAKPLSESRLFEIGYGARPLRLFIFSSMGCDVRGIDLDAPVIDLRPSDYLRVIRQNGVERGAKSIMRNVLFDAKIYDLLKERLKARGVQPAFNREGLLVGNAAEFAFDQVDLFFSSDVFEHIPPDQLKYLLDHLHSACNPDTILIITPNIYTGITGNHLKEWYGSKVEQNLERESEPWEHLRKDRFQANTYLNKLWRKDYRELFGQRFEILDELVMYPEQGRQYLTGATAVELADIDPEELFSNQVSFIMKPK